jgi:hypothetical protein
MRAQLLAFAILVPVMLIAMTVGQRYAEFVLRPEVLTGIVVVAGLSTLGAVIVAMHVTRSRRSPSRTDQES